VSWQEFVTKILGLVLSWPDFGLVALLVLRQPITAAIGRIRTIEGLGVSGTFGADLARVEEEVGALTEEPAAGGSQEDLALAQHAPAGAVLYAWSDVERSLRRLTGLYGQTWPNSRGRSASGSGAESGSMVEGGILPGGLLQPIQELRLLRNKVAHGAHEPTTGEALTFMGTAQDVRDVLDRLSALKEREPE
jgi:hypothetical protein